MKIKMGLNKLKRFLSLMNAGIVETDALREIKQVILDDILPNKVFTQSLDNVYQVDIHHGGFTVRPGSYNWDYARWKTAHGLPPHVKTGRMKSSLKVFIDKRKVVMEIPKKATTTKPYTLKSGGPPKVFNFGPIHETRKSILKSTFALGWNDIMRVIKETYKKAAENA